MQKHKKTRARSNSPLTMEELLLFMNEHNACSQAMAYVIAFCDEPEQAWTMCEEHAWLLWLAGRLVCVSNEYTDEIQDHLERARSLIRYIVWERFDHRSQLDCARANLPWGLIAKSIATTVRSWDSAELKHARRKLRMRQDDGLLVEAFADHVIDRFWDIRYYANMPRRAR